MTVQHYVLIVIVTCVRVSNQFAINNTVAEIKLGCSDRGILLKVVSEKPLDRPGRIHVKGQNSRDSCSIAIPFGLQEFEFNVPLGNCNMDKSSIDKTSGAISYHIVYVVSFHPIFITKVDRAYRLTCTFGPTNDMVMVTNFFSVSMLPTTEIPAQIAGSLSCSYSIHSQDTNGPELRYTNIGEKVVHVWKCDNLQSTQFMWVHSCSVSPEFGNGTKIIDERGCTLDRIVIDQLQYPRMDMVIGHHHAYKFADYPTLLFKCSITICDTVRRNCPIMNVPPDCQYPNYYDFPPGRTRREIENKPLVTLKVNSEPLSVFAINEDIPLKYPTGNMDEGKSDKICIGQLAILTAFLSLISVILFIQCIYFIVKRRRTNKVV